MNIANWLYATSLVRPAAPALYNGTTLVANYASFAHQAFALSRLLQEKYQLGQGDRIAFYLPNCTQYLVLFYATWWLGATAVPINHKLHKKEAAWILANAQTSIVYTDSGSEFLQQDLPDGCIELGINKDWVTDHAAKNVRTQPPAATNSADLAWLFYTSGTTGRPKGVMLTHANLVAMSLCYPLDVDSLGPTDAALYAAPMSHGAGLYNMIFVRVGGAHVVPESRGFDSQEVFNLATTFKQLSMFAAPTMVKRLVAKAQEVKFKNTALKTIILGGGPMYAADLVEAIEVLGPCFAHIYGQGETPMTITSIPRELLADSTNPLWRERLSSVGTAQSCIEVRVVDAQLQPVAAKIAGEILVRGPTVMQGYWQNPEASSTTIVDGWLRTGDIGYMDEDGFLYLTDRSKDVIITGGTNVYPREVEEVLIQHPDLFEVAVVGAPNAEWGEEVVAFVVSNNNKNIDEAALDSWCKNHMASFKKPKRYIQMSQLPKNNYGKVPKTELRRLLKH